VSVRLDAVEAGGATPPATATSTRQPGVRMVRVWDSFVRMFHWSLLGLFVLAFATGDELEKVHIVVGYVIVALLTLRVVWGFVGPRHARFSDFVRPPGETLGYARRALRGRPPRHLGHNPLGGLMIVAMLATLTAVAATGFMMTTDAFWGAEWVEDLHEALVYGMLVLIALHVGGVIVGSWEHRENLVKAMITGRKRA
jgi:cytochrome b